MSSTGVMAPICKSWNEWTISTHKAKHMKHLYILSALGYNWGEQFTLFTTLLNILSMLLNEGKNVRNLYCSSLFN